MTPSVLKPFAACCIALWLAGPAFGQEPVDYAKQIKPILKERCFACHGALKQESALRLDTGRSIRQGGDSGAAVLPQNSRESLLLARVSAKDLSERMPPEGEPLTDKQIELLRRWIEQGATSPDDEQPEADPREHWSFRPLVRPPLPSPEQSSGATGAQNPIDAFLVHDLSRDGLTPQPRASKPVLLRRVYLDLIGLPPTREELQAFLADDSPDAYAGVVDRLLNSPQYGERWGRHWMDVWRYSDWYGRRHVPDVWNGAPQIWRWRDWIVRSLNDDKGYDRMIREMLAADEICPDEPENAVATGYLLRNWYALNPNDWMRNTVEHTGKAFLGLTFNCAHCHDHKYDPIAHEDYFRLRAFFEPMYIRQDRVAGEADPGPFQDYEYSKLRLIQQLGAVRVFDKSPDAKTWFYSGGDERNRDEKRGSIPPGVPAILAAGMPEIKKVELPARGWYPGLQPGIQQTVFDDARNVVSAADRQLAEETRSTATALQSARDRLASAEKKYASELEQATAAGRSAAIAGKQSLILDATEGRRVLQHRLAGIEKFPGGTAIEFQLALMTDAHVNFQLARDVEKGLTAGFVAFDHGRIVAYRPGTFSDFEVGRYRFDEGQHRFHVQLVLQPDKDACLLTVRSIPDRTILAEQVSVALNGWDPAREPAQAISFDARTGSRVAVDDVVIRTSSAEIAGSGASLTVAKFDFEPTVYPEGRDVVGIEGWEASQFSVPPATSVLSRSVEDATLIQFKTELSAAHRELERLQLPVQAAEATLRAARTELASIEARVAADRAKYGETPGVDASALARKAGQIEQDAKRQRVEADVLAGQSAVARAEAKPVKDADRAKAIETANQQLAAARSRAEKYRSTPPSTAADAYTALSPVYPQTSTGRRSALAQWMTSRDNSLTARVAVNHMWLRHFHSPLVATVYDFGRNGAQPTHPQLLDWLAVELMDSGWSMKHLHRLIVTSEAYQRSSSVGGANQNVARDPENKRLWRMNTCRMEAEVVRDSLLFCGGTLDQREGGQPMDNKLALTTDRRSLYYEIFPEDGGADALSALFDAPDPLDCYRRTRSVVPQQALALTNSDLVHQVSQRVVRDWERQHESADHTAFVVEMFEQILSRRPTEVEQRLCMSAIDEQIKTLAVANKSDVEVMSRARQSLVRALLNHNDFVTIR